MLWSMLACRFNVEQRICLLNESELKRLNHGTQSLVAKGRATAEKCLL